MDYAIEVKLWKLLVGKCLWHIAKRRLQDRS